MEQQARLIIINVKLCVNWLVKIQTDTNVIIKDPRGVMVKLLIVTLDLRRLTSAKRAHLLDLALSPTNINTDFTLISATIV